MTNADHIVDALRREPGLTDSELRQRTGVSPHQQVNQICRRLEVEDRLRRVSEADGLIHNFLTGAPALRPPAPTARLRSDEASPVAHPAPPGRAEHNPGTDRWASSITLLLVPCSGRKQAGGTPGARGTGVTDLLPQELAERLAHTRLRVAERAGLDESALLPAWQRYAGTFYTAAGRPSAQQPTVIISGGYGLLLPDEAIGVYDRRFSMSDWPRGLLEACLVALCARFDQQTVVAFCARSTGYADLVRRTPWASESVHAYLAAPRLTGRGAQVLVPRASGEAYAQLSTGNLEPTWRSSDGVDLDMQEIS